LGEKLNKTIGEIQQMEVIEFMRWVAYFEIKTERENGNK